MTESKTFCPQLFENGLSYLSVPGPPLSPLTLGQLVEEAATKWGNFECFYDVPRDKRLTFSQLKTEVDLFASGLLKMGLNPGDRIGIWGPNSSRWIITFLAAAKIGLIIVPLKISCEAPELLYALNYLSLKCLVLAEPSKMRDFYKILNHAVPDMKVSEGNSKDGSPIPIPIPIPIISSIVAPHLNKIIYMGTEQLNGGGSWTDVQKMGKEVADLDRMKKLAETVQFDDIFYTPFTSVRNLNFDWLKQGTTGQPKGVMISHHGFVNTLFTFGKTFSLTQQDRQCLILPAFHMWGCLVAMFPLGFGCSVLIPSAKFSASTAIKTTAQEKCTWIQGTPTMHFDMMNTPGFDLLDLSSLKGVVTGGADASKTLVNHMKANYRVPRVVVGYGLSEAICLTQIRIEDPPKLSLISVGYPLDNTELKIVDAQGRLVRVGEAGEICARTYRNTRGYWEDPEKTREVIDTSGWVHSGDAGYFLESGHLVIVGRFKDMLIRGGENIYPKEIEDFLYDILREEMEQVYVFGVADERLGEVVAAWILPKPNPGVTMDTDYIKRVCEGKISRSKIPVYVKFVQSKEEFPRTPIGKVQKNVMRQLFEKELGLNQKP